MFPIRKRKATHGTFIPDKKARVETSVIMPTPRKYMAYRKKQYKRRFATKTAKHMNNGKFFTPAKTQPPIKKRPWEWIQVRLSLLASTTTFQAITVAEISAQLSTQISTTAASIKVSSIQLWNQAGVGTLENTPYIELRPNSLASGQLMGKEEDFGNLNEPASVGYKWSNTECQEVFPGTSSSRTVANYNTGGGKNCYAHCWIQYLL